MKMANAIGEDIKDKYVMLKKKYVDDPVLRVLYARDGFGCSPNTMGNAVFVTQVANGRETRVEGYQLERLATEEEVAKAKEYYEEHRPEQLLDELEGLLETVIRYENRMDDICHELEQIEEWPYECQMDYYSKVEQISPTPLTYARGLYEYFRGDEQDE